SPSIGRSPRCSNAWSRSTRSGRLRSRCRRSRTSSTGTWRHSAWTSSSVSVSPIRSSVVRAARPLASTLTRRWAPRSRLFLVGEGAGWSIDHDLRELARIAARLDVRTASPRLLTVSAGQAAFFGSQFTLLREPWRPLPHALGTAYFHGRPGTPGMPEFDVSYALLRVHHAELARVQVTHAEMHELVLSSGIDP